jgi:hypothetical protein
MGKLDNTRFCSYEDETILILTLADGLFELDLKGAELFAHIASGLF